MGSKRGWARDARVGLSLFAVLAASCSDAGETDGEGGATSSVDASATVTASTGAGTGGSGGGTSAPTFGVCPPGYVDECATLRVPLDHANPGGEAIDLHIARKRAAMPAKRQLWLLSGGPGQGGQIWERFIGVLAPLLPDTDIYAIDHRGTGYSHRLTCTAQDKPNTAGGYLLAVSGVPSCLAELQQKGDYDRLAYFTTAQAARDVVFASQATRTADQQVFIYGGSYGTHWAHRVLQVGEAQIDGVIFDGYMTPEKFSFTHYDEGIEEVGKVLAAQCAADASCAARMGPDPAARAREVWEELDASPCAGSDGAYGRTLASLFVDNGFRNKAFLFPLIHRLGRCNAADAVAINKLFQSPTLFGTSTGPELFLNSGVLQYNIVLSELWSVPGEALPTKAELEARADAQTFLVEDSYPAGIVHLRDTWPLPPDDHATLPLPVPTSKPLLWVSGGLDSRTPPTQSLLVASLYTAPNQPLLVLPTAIHTPVWGAPLASDPTRTCGNTLIPSFVHGALDTSCASDLAPVRLEAPDEAFATMWWGVADDWGDEAPKAKPLGPVVQPLATEASLPLQMPDPLGALRAQQALAKVRRAMTR